MKLFAIPAILLFASLPVFGDPITKFADLFGPSGSVISTSLTLVPGANPLIAAVREPWMPPNMSNLSFAEAWPGPQTMSVLFYTLTLDNLPAPLIFDFGPGRTCPAGETCVLAGIDFSVPTTSNPVNGTLTVHFNDQIETFDSHYLWKCSR